MYSFKNTYKPLDAVSPRRFLLFYKTKSANRYQFGFNGQLKDNEIYGEGNAYTAEFWEYDPRSIRRWNRDPVVKPWESPYAAFSNNSILLADPNGDDAEKRAKRYEKKLTDRGDGATSRKLEDGTFEVTTVKSIKNKEEGTTDYVFSTKTFKDNWLDRTGKKIVKGLQSADGWLNSKKGNSYGEGEDWVKSVGFVASGSISLQPLFGTSLTVGIYSTNEYNAIFIFDYTASNQINLDAGNKLDLKGGVFVGIIASSDNLYESGKSIDRSMQTEIGTASFLKWPIQAGYVNTLSTTGNMTHSVKLGMGLGSMNGESNISLNQDISYTYKSKPINLRR